MVGLHLRKAPAWATHRDRRSAFDHQPQQVSKDKGLEISVAKLFGFEARATGSSLYTGSLSSQYTGSLSSQFYSPTPSITFPLNKGSDPSVLSTILYDDHFIPFAEPDEAKESGHLISAFPAVGTRIDDGITAADAAHSPAYLLPKSGPSATYRRPWGDGPLRAKKVVKQANNQLLHMSISALEQAGKVPQMPSLRDTIRCVNGQLGETPTRIRHLNQSRSFIIGNCFASSPTRQNIVDFLFEALPEQTRMGVQEIDVKKYYKARPVPPHQLYYS